MDFKPFVAPPSEHHQFGTGLSSELGVSPKSFVDGVNAYFKHLFAAVEQPTETKDAERITELEEAVAALQQRNDALEGNVKALLASFDRLESQIVALIAPKEPAT